MDSDCTWLRWLSGSSTRWVVLFGRGKVGAAFCKAAFSLRKEALVARKEANYYWWSPTAPSPVASGAGS